MNKVDVQVRTLLNTYPTLFSDRLSALYNIFTNSGYEWDEEGCMQPIFAPHRDPNVMDFSDLEEGDARLAEDGKDVTDYMRDLHAMRVFEAKKERMMRELLAANIDTVAKQMPSMASLSYERMGNTSFYPLERAPWGKIDADWLEALEEFIDCFVVSFNRVFSLQYDNPLKGEKAPEPSMFSRMPPYYQNLHTKLMEISEKVEAQSGKRARMAAFMESMDFKQMMDEVLAEDNKPC